MKNKLTTIYLAFLSLGALLFGCTTTNAPDIPRIAAAVQEAARIGTAEATRDHPEWRLTRSRQPT